MPMSFIRWGNFDAVQAKIFPQSWRDRNGTLCQLFNTSTYRNVDQPYGFFIICLPEDVQINKVRRIFMFLRFKLDYWDKIMVVRLVFLSVTKLNSCQPTE